MLGPSTDDHGSRWSRDAAEGAVTPRFANRFAKPS